jgi:hypothetical protein
MSAMLEITVQEVPVLLLVELENSVLEEPLPRASNAQLATLVPTILLFQ